MIQNTAMYLAITQWLPPGSKTCYMHDYIAFGLSVIGKDEVSILSAKTISS